MQCSFSEKQSSHINLRAVMCSLVLQHRSLLETSKTSRRDHHGTITRCCPGNASESWKLWKLCLGTRTLAEVTWYLVSGSSGSLKPSSQQLCWHLKSSQHPKPLGCFKTRIGANKQKQRVKICFAKEDTAVQ